LPYVFTQIAPIFNIFGGFYGTTYIRFTNIVVGTPSAANFAPPSGPCNFVPYNPEKEVFNYFSDPSKFLDHFLQKSLYKAETIIKAIDHLRTTPNHIIKKEETIINKRSEQQVFPPQLNPTFSANYVFNGSQFYKANGVIITGKVAMDYTQSGFAISVDSITGSFPFDLQAEIRIFPSRGGFDIIGVGPNGQSCYDYIFFQWLWSILLPQYQIPPYSVQGPDQKVNGVDCTVWSFSNPATMLFVRKSDNTLIQISSYFQSFGYSTVTLYNVQPTVSPSQYSRPSTCIEILGWSHNWASHLPWGWCDPYCWIWW